MGNVQKTVKHLEALRKLLFCWIFAQYFPKLNTHIGEKTDSCQLFGYLIYTTITSMLDFPHTCQHSHAILRQLNLSTHKLSFFVHQKCSKVILTSSWF
jgi:hypothetical protein